VNHITSNASNPVSTIKCFSGSFTVPRQTDRQTDRERESKFSIAEHTRDLGQKHLLVNSKLSPPKRPLHL